MHQPTDASGVIETHYRFAEPGELPVGSVVDIKAVDPTTIHVIVRPGHAKAALLDEMGEHQRTAFRTGQWTRLAPTPEARVHPRRVWHANWELVPHDRIPEGVHCLSFERPGRHSWLVREGEASPELVAEMSLLLRRMVRAEVWIQRGAGEGGPTEAPPES
ncbi:hypothetical protein ACFWZY_01740 [Streptomyces sp. NPDC058992]|uniref:hypothetical protein n=1 Tax=Streptomyces sp. NPDC058992 TaxID=3346688 RepID=UPI00369C1556